MIKALKELYELMGKDVIKLEIDERMLWNCKAKDVDKDLLIEQYRQYQEELRQCKKARFLVHAFFAAVITFFLSSVVQILQMTLPFIKADYRISYLAVVIIFSGVFTLIFLCWFHFVHAYEMVEKVKSLTISNIEERFFPVSLIVHEEALLKVEKKKKNYMPTIKQEKDLIITFVIFSYGVSNILLAWHGLYTGKISGTIAMIFIIFMGMAQYFVSKRLRNAKYVA